MMNYEKFQKLIAGIPTTLAGDTLPAKLSRQYRPDWAVPGIIITILTTGVRVRWHHDEIRCVQNTATKDYDIWHGNTQRATISLIIVSEDPERVINYAADMVNQLYQYRLGLDWYTDRIRFVDVLSAPFVFSFRNERTEKLVHRCHIDFAVEYEVSWQVLDPSIHRFGVDINDYINMIMYCDHTKQISLKMDIFTKRGKSTTYGMSVSLV